MAISAMPFYEREREIIRKLQGVSGDEWEKIQHLQDIVLDIKKSSGKWSIAYILRGLYQGDVNELKKDLANLTLMGEKFNPPQVDKFLVLSAIWPSISGLCTVDEDFLNLTKNMVWGVSDLYKNSRI